MKRGEVPCRTDWEAEVRKYLSSADTWCEGAYYEFEEREISQLESASAELHAMTLSAVERAVSNEAVFARFHIPATFHDMVQESWKRRDPSVYGRLDLVYDGRSPPQLIEYNGDTPALLGESSPAQWYWFEQQREPYFPEADQFNTVYEGLQRAWYGIKDRLRAGETFHFVSSRRSNTADDDWNVCEYHAEVARHCGIRTKQGFIDDLEYRYRDEILIDPDGRAITKLFKLYPWNWFGLDKGKAFLPALSKGKIGFLEPPWKMLVDHKGLLALLWEMFPHHPNLLPAFWDCDSSLGSAYVAKPIFGCEGESLAIHDGHDVVSTPGTYSDNPVIYQALAELPRFGDKHALIGSWIIGDEPHGIVVREGETRITDNTWKVVPHVFFG